MGNDDNDKEKKRTRRKSYLKAQLKQNEVISRNSGLVTFVTQFCLHVSELKKGTIKISY